MIMKEGTNIMYIYEMIDKHRNDFRAIMKCEHCNHNQNLSTGYDDEYYHNKVIPAMKCSSCGMSSNDSIES